MPMQCAEDSTSLVLATQTQRMISKIASPHRRISSVRVLSFTTSKLKRYEGESAYLLPCRVRNSPQRSNAMTVFATLCNGCAKTLQQLVMFMSQPRQRPTETSI